MDGVELAPGWLRATPAGMAWLGLRELHLRAIQAPRHSYATRAGQLTPPQAYPAFGTTVTAVLGQLAVTDAAAGLRILQSLVAFADTYGSLDGVEAPFVSAVRSAARAGRPTDLGPALTLWRRLGQPGPLGGGARTAPVLTARGAVLTAAEAGRLDDLLDPATSPLPRQAAAAAGPVAERLRPLARAWAQAMAAVPTAAEFASVPADLAAPLHQASRHDPALAPPPDPRATLAAIGQGRMVVVDVSTLRPPPDPPPPAPPPGRPPALTPALAGYGSPGDPAFWRRGTVVLPTVVPVGPGVDGLTSAAGPDSTAAPAPPALDARGLVSSRGFLAGWLVSPGAHLAESTDTAVPRQRPGVVRAVPIPDLHDLMTYPPWMLGPFPPVGGGDGGEPIVGLGLRLAAEVVRTDGIL
ncbi:hypothetical protein ACGFI9_09875 [Micromonospora sp. NPDC048930]|uniref:hypothetical protein n=1 Tax=Micromonospora sp. NPDC048930 TaxID=3364261 RepID=UPI0037182A7F